MPRASLSVSSPQQKGDGLPAAHHSTAIRTLNNPRYAGVYFYGRRQYRRAVDGKKLVRSRERDDWLACILNAHPGYITWEQFQRNPGTLEINGLGYEVARGSPPREGTALLQGRAVCGRCGRHLRARYAARRGRLESWYVCDRAHGSHGERYCQSIAGAPIDDALGKLITDRRTPAAVELALEIRKEIEARHAEADRLRPHAVERARIDALSPIHSSANGTISCAHWPRRRRKESGGGREPSSLSTTRSVIGSSP